MFKSESTCRKRYAYTIFKQLRVRQNGSLHVAIYMRHPIKKNRGGITGDDVADGAFSRQGAGWGVVNTQYGAITR